jgi:hypothetical protein
MAAATSQRRNYGMDQLGGRPETDKQLLHLEPMAREARERAVWGDLCCSPDEGQVVESLSIKLD